MPVLSVILPAYNAEKFIDEAVNSILNQTFSDFELLIVDDFSTDKTRLKIQRFNDSRIKKFYNDKNLGKNESVNRVLIHCKGEFLTIHDADDISLPLRFEKQLSYLIKNPEYYLVGCDFISFKDEVVLGKSSLEAKPDAIREKIKKGSQFHGPTVVFRKDVIGKVGGLYRYFVRGEDIDFTMRVVEKYNTSNLSDCLYLYRENPSSLTKDIKGFDYKRFADLKLLYYLMEERLTRGTDLLLEGKIYEVEKLVRSWEIDIKKNEPLKPMEFGIAKLLYFGFYYQALKLALMMLINNPNCFKAYRVLLYTLKVALFKRKSFTEKLPKHFIV